MCVHWNVKMLRYRKKLAVTKQFISAISLNPHSLDEVGTIIHSHPEEEKTKFTSVK